MIKVDLTSSRAGEGVYCSLKGAVKGIVESPRTFCCFIYDDFWDLEGNHTLDGMVKDEDLHFVDITPAFQLKWPDGEYVIDFSDLKKLFEPYCYPGSVIVFHFKESLYHPSLVVLERIEEFLNTQYPCNAYQQVYLFVKGNKELYERVYGSKRPPVNEKIREEVIRARSKCATNSVNIFHIAGRAKRLKSLFNKSGIVLLSGDDFALLTDLAEEGICTEVRLLEKDLAYTELLDKFDSIQEKLGGLNGLTCKQGQQNVIDSQQPVGEKNA